MELIIISNNLVESRYVDSKFFGLFVFFIIFIVFGGFVLNWLFNLSYLGRVILWIGLYGGFSVVWYLLFFI